MVFLLIQPMVRYINKISSVPKLPTTMVESPTMKLDHRILNCWSQSNSFIELTVVVIELTSISNQSCIFRVVQVIKWLQDPPEVWNNLTGINDNARERGLEQKCFYTLMEGWQRRGRYHIVRQAVPDGGSGDWEGPARPPTVGSLTHGTSRSGGSVAEWLACWTQAQKGPGSNRSRDAVG